MLQVARRRRNRRELRHLLRRAPRQDRRRAARAGVRQPRLWPTPRGATGSRIRASAPVPRRPTAQRRRRARAGGDCRPENRTRRRRTGTTAAANARRPLPRSRVAGSAGRSIAVASSPVRSAHAIAELVVPEIDPDAVSWLHQPYVLYASSISAGATMVRPVAPRGGSWTRDARQPGWRSVPRNGGCPATFPTRWKAAGSIC